MAYSTESFTLDESANSDRDEACEVTVPKSTEGKQTTQQKITTFVVKNTPIKIRNQGKKRRRSKKSSSTEDDSLNTQTIEEVVRQVLEKQLCKMDRILEEAMTKIIAKCTTEIHKIANDKLECITKELNEVTEGIAFRDKEIRDLQEDNETLATKLKEYEGRLIRCEKQITEAKEETIDLKIRSMNNNVVFYNIPENNDTREDCIKTIDHFLKSHMRIEDTHVRNQIQFERVHRMGQKQNGKCRPIVAKCVNGIAKSTIFSYVKNLKGKPFGVADQYPTEVTERRNYLSEQYRQAKRQNQNTKWVKEGLLINGQLIKKPNDREIFASSLHEPTAPSDIKHTEVFTEMNSSFQGHAVKIQEQSEVIPTLNKLFANHTIAKANHNSYAYILKSKGKIISNSNDDGEFGAGKRMLNYLQQENVGNIMVVVTKWSGPQRMGPKRFQCILEAQKSAIACLN